MSAKQLLDKLERLGKVDAKTLSKMRKQVADPTKRVSVRSILNFLVEQNYLSQSEAELLAQTADDVRPDFGQATVSMGTAKRELDTDDLLGENLLVSQPTAAPRPAVPSKPTAMGKPAEPPAADVSWTVADVPGARIGADHLDPFHRPQEFAARELPRSEVLPSAKEFADVAPTPAARPTFSGKKVHGNPWESKWLFLGFGLLALLVLTTVVLWWFLTRTTAEAALADAAEKFKQENFPAARDAYLDFIDKFAGESKIPFAQAMAVNALLRSSYNTKNWGQTKRSAVEEIPKLFENENNEVAAIQDELSVILPQTALGLSELAVAATTTEEKRALLADSEELMSLIINPAVIPPSRLKADYVQPKLADRQKNVDQVNYEVNREVAYQQALEQIAQLLVENNTNQASSNYHELVRKYPILRIRQPLIELVGKISERESKLVVPVDVQTETFAEDLPEKTAARTLLVAPQGRSLDSLKGKVLTYLIHGTVFGMSAADGRILWWRNVGLETNIGPQWTGVPHQSDLILSDLRRQQVLRVSAANGQLVWRTKIGGPFLKPAVTRGNVFVTTRDPQNGPCDVLKLNIDTGKVELACRIPQAATVGPVAHPDVGLLYQLGRQSSVYILSQEDLSGKEVLYLGHQPDSVDIEPFWLSGSLCVLENFAQHCQAYVIGFRQRGLEAFESQPSFAAIQGKVTQDVFRYGRSVLFSSDSGELRMYELVIAADDEQAVATMQPQITGKVQTYEGLANYFVVDRGDMYLANKGLTKYRILRSQQVFELRTTSDAADVFVGPVVAFENAVIHLRRRYRSSMITAAAVDPESLEEIWRTDFAAPAVDPPFVLGDRLLAISPQGDLFELSSEAFANRFALPATRGSTVRENLQFDRRASLNDGTVVVYGRDCDRVLAYRPNDTAQARLNPMQQPADRPGGEPAPMGKYLLVPSRDGQVIRIDPLNGFAVGAPFQPAIRPNQLIRWTRPAVFNEQNTFVIGTDQGTIFSVEATGDQALVRKGQLEAGAGFVSPIVAVDNRVFGVTRDGITDRLVSYDVFPELTAVGTFPLDEPYVGSLAGLGENLLLVTANSNLVCLSPELRVVWQVSLSGKVAGEPILADGAILLALETGEVRWIDPASGQTIKSIEVDSPLASVPFSYRGAWYVSDQIGVVHAIEPTP